METFNRIRIEISGMVQGVGFRPFVYRLAKFYRLTGWVLNNPSGVIVEAQGPPLALKDFARSLRLQAPPFAQINDMVVKDVPAVSGSDFEIRESDGQGSGALVVPDLGVCSDCLRELFDPDDRRYRYPFINCTNCGPRYTIIKDVPYDRDLTTMAHFRMCPACREEYENPANRRFHAQPNACPACGPSLSLLDSKGRSVSGDPLATAIDLLQEGRIIALKGIGGFHLAVDACNDQAVEELRRRKHRDHKPFALMAPDLRTLATFAVSDEDERMLLMGPERPIVLLRKKEGNRLSPLVAPNNGYLGVMLPYAPLHHLLLRERFTALVMTSGNVADEPIAFRHDGAFDRLRSLADFSLTHDREIHTPSDDSVVRVFGGSPVFLRRSRGYTPRAIDIPDKNLDVLAVGAELKGVACLTRGNKAFLSQHIGDLKNATTLRSLEETVSHLKQILRVDPDLVAHDYHPDYLSTSYAQGFHVTKVAVQHHHAHLASCMAENGLDGEVIGVILDGTGYGEDGTIWGGEFLTGGYSVYERRGHFRCLPLPGGDAAVREPFRMALSYLYDAYGEDAFDLPLPCVAQVKDEDRPLFLKMLQGEINSPLTSSCGRLFDAVAALVGLRSKVSYEGQAAIELESLADSASSAGTYPYEITRSHEAFVCDFRAMIREMVTDLASTKTSADIARAFHNTLAAAVVDVCSRIRRGGGFNRVVLSGGVFQNRMLTEGVQALLVKEGFEVFTHRLVPPNDGGIALGQAMVAGKG